MKRWRTAGSLAAALCVAVIMACKSKATEKSETKEPETENPETVKPEKEKPSVPVVVRAACDSNGGRPLYLLVRRTTHEGFVEDDYSTVANLVTASDETVIGKIVVFPGQEYTIDVKDAPETIGVYGLFTKAKGQSWKVMFEKASQIEVSIGVSAIKRVDADQHGQP